MQDVHYPTISTVEFIKILEKSAKIIPEKLAVGSTIVFTLAGTGFIGKRQITIRTSIEEVGHDRSIGVAHRLGCLSELMNWFEKNKNWKEGGYTVREDKS